jgi:hypothetical protein
MIIKSIFTVNPRLSCDRKAVTKAIYATQYIGFGVNSASSTELYRQQAGVYANTGVYSSEDVVFVSVNGRRGNATDRKKVQDATIRLAILAISNGAILLTDNDKYIATSDYNEGEKRLALCLAHYGYVYSTITLDNILVGCWTNPLF